jgi:hypothetical protein
MGFRAVAWAVALLLWSSPALAQLSRHRPRHAAAAVARPPKAGFKRVPQTYVVNLPARKDRLAQVTRELAAVGVSNFSVTPGIVHQCGALGCSLSHILTLQKCVDSRARACLVVEDDFELTVPPERAGSLLDQLLDVPGSEWDFVFLASRVVSAANSSFAFLDRVADAHTTSAYIVSGRYAPTLLDAFLRSAHLLNEHACDMEQYAIDMFMKRLQPVSRWYVFKPKLGKQCKSYSDVAFEERDYGVRR